MLVSCGNCGQAHELSHNHVCAADQAKVQDAILTELRAIRVLLEDVITGRRQMYIR